MTPVKRQKIQVALIVSTLILLMMTCFVMIARDETFGQEMAIPNSSLLRAEKEKIYKDFVVDDVRCDIDGSCENFGKIVKYYYAKPVKESIKTFDGTIKVKDTESKKEVKYNEIDVSLEEIGRGSSHIHYQGYDSDGKERFVTELFDGLQFVQEKSTGDWYELEAPATTTVSAWDIQTVSRVSWFKKLLGYEASADTDTFYPGDSISSSTCMYRIESSAGWAAARNAADATAVRTGDECYGARVYHDGGSAYQAERGFITFDTKSIPDGNTIDSATLSLYGNDKTAVVTRSHRLYDSTHEDSLTTADYDTNGTTEMSDTYFTITSWNASAYNVFTLNAAGLSNINKTGLTKFSVVEQVKDVSDVAPTTAGDFHISWFNPTKAGTANDPKLVVVHTAAAAAAAFGANNIMW